MHFPRACLGLINQHKLFFKNALQCRKHIMGCGNLSINKSTIYHSLETGSKPVFFITHRFRHVFGDDVSVMEEELEDGGDHDGQADHDIVAVQVPPPRGQVDPVSLFRRQINGSSINNVENIAVTKLFTPSFPSGVIYGQPLTQWIHYIISKFYSNNFFIIIELKHVDIRLSPRVPRDRVWRCQPPVLLHLQESDLQRRKKREDNKKWQSLSSFLPFIKSERIFSKQSSSFFSRQVTKSTCCVRNRKICNSLR